MRLEVHHHPFWQHIMETMPAPNTEYTRAWYKYAADLASSVVMGPSSEIVAFCESLTYEGVLAGDKHARFRRYDHLIAQYLLEGSPTSAWHTYHELCAYGQDVLDVLERG